MSDQVSQGPLLTQKMRDELARSVSESAGEVLDAHDEFCYYASEWIEAFQRVFPLDSGLWQHPIGSRDLALSILASGTCIMTLETSMMLRSGLVRPATAWLRGLYETHIDARFIELDLTGLVAYRWMHWGVADRARLRPDDAEAQRDYSRSKQIFQNERSYGKPGHWAKQPRHRRPYTTLSARAKYVDQWNREEPGYTDVQDTATRLREELLAKTNAQVHPTIAGNENIFNLQFISFMAVHYTMFTLLAYKNVMDDHREYWRDGTRGDHWVLYPPGNDHLIELANNVHTTYLNMAEVIRKQPSAD